MLLRKKFLNIELDNIKTYFEKGCEKDNYFENKIKRINEKAYKLEKDTIIKIIKELKNKITNNKKVNEGN